MGLLAILVSPGFAEGGKHVVQRGDTLSSVAQRYSVSVESLAAANGLSWDSWVYVGQELLIPDSGNAREAPVEAAATTESIYVVQRGDTLSSIARRHGTTVAAVKQANRLSTNTIYPGQRLTIPAAGSRAQSGELVNPESLTGERWIDVDITNQRLTAYVGQTPVFVAPVSTGIWKYPTVTGTYHIYVKYRAADMSGGSGADYYYLRDVPYVMYFFRGYGLHGTYWHNNFGTPMSHGCVNLSIPDAEWLFNFAEVGTKVVTHY
jgi:lipoprotein-anchoring transpeptidase ErfK/SrfK